jgi:hypothetical protein
MAAWPFSVCNAAKNKFRMNVSRETIEHNLKAFSEFVLSLK